MSIAEKLATIAENEEKIYNTGKAEGKAEGLALFKGTATATIENITEKDLEGVTEIVDYAFYGCKKLKILELPEGITRIGVAAFNSCYAIKAPLVLPSTLTAIGTNAFRYCSNINRIISKAKTPPTLTAANAIQTASALYKIVVPKGCGDAYKTAPYWADYANIIEEEV
jgi:hypothetical protein